MSERDRALLRILPASDGSRVDFAADLAPEGAEFGIASELGEDASEGHGPPASRANDGADRSAGHRGAYAASLAGCRIGSFTEQMRQWPEFSAPKPPARRNG